MFILVFILLFFLFYSVPRTGQELSDTEITAFWKDFHTHTYNSFGIELGRFRLSHISFPDIAFNYEAVSLY